MDSTMDVTHLLLQRWSGVQLGLAVGFVFIVILIIDEILFAPKDDLGFPRYGNGRLRAWLTWSPVARMDLHNAVQQGYEDVNMARDMPFVVKMSGTENVVLPPRYLSLLKSETRSRLSLAESFNNLMNMSATVGDEAVHDEIEIEVVAKLLNPNLSKPLKNATNLSNVDILTLTSMKAKLTPFMVDQLAYALDKEVGPVPEWRTFNISQLNAQIINILVNRMLVGEELSRDPSYIRMCQSYTFSFLVNAFFWNFRPPRLIAKWVYWMAAWPHRRDVRRSLEYLVPLVSRRAAELPNQDPKQKPLDMVQWLLEMPVPRPEDGTPKKHAERLLHLTFASSAVSMALVTHLLHQILSYPEYLEPLRDEITHSLQEHGGWTEKALSNMPYLDSFVRETIRLHPPGVLTGHRTVLQQDFRFSDELQLPPKTRICFPTMPIHLDPNNYDSPKQFMPFRFVKARKGTDDAGNESMGASQIDPTYLSFGYGKQSCPGRFFAVRQIKLVFATLLNNYEMKWGNRKRPVYMTVEGMVFASMSTSISLKERQKS